LAEVAKSLTRLRSVEVLECEEVMSLRDYRAIGGLTQLQRLVIANSVRILRGQGSLPAAPLHH